MTEQQTRRPKAGDIVVVGDAKTRFAVIDFDGSTFLLESEHGVRCRAGVRVVRFVPMRKEKAA